jgi:hypothetical protein
MGSYAPRFPTGAQCGGYGGVSPPRPSDRLHVLASETKTLGARGAHLSALFAGEKIPVLQDE